jgi:hypothetical protein
MNSFPKTATSRPFPAPSQLYKKRKGKIEAEMAEQADHPNKTDIGLANSPKGPESAHSQQSWLAAPHRHVEQYLCCWLQESVRQLLEDWLEEHPDVAEEDALAYLVERGLFKDYNDAGESEAVKKADQQVRLARKLQLRAARRCQG